jgi:DNA-binding response OmpR family regulator
LISPFASDHSTLSEVFSRADWQLYAAATCEEGLRLLERESIPVVICDRALKDGSWENLLDSIREMPAPPKLIVSTRFIDERIRTDVLKAGGFDVLTSPFDPRDVFATVSLAWHLWKHQYKSAHSAERLLETAESEQVSLAAEPARKAEERTPE